MSQPVTKEVMRRDFLAVCQEIVKFWQEREGESRDDVIESAVWSVLVALDGGSYLPSFALIPMPHPTDQAWFEDQGKDYYPSPPDLSAYDIGGDLHGQFYSDSFDAPEWAKREGK